MRGCPHSSLMLALTITTAVFLSSTLLPTEAQISFTDAWNNDTYVSWQFTITANVYATSVVRFYLNTDNNASTGYLDSFRQMGAEILFETTNNTNPTPAGNPVAMYPTYIYSSAYTATASNVWDGSWNYITSNAVAAGGSGTIDFRSGLVTFTVPRSTIKVGDLTVCGRTMGVLATVDYSTGVQAASEIYTHVFSPADTCTSNVAVVTLPVTLPMLAKADQTSVTLRIAYSGAATGTPTLYLDTDRVATTGGAAGTIGADYKLVAGSLQKYSAGAWTVVSSTVNYTNEASKQRATWNVPRSLLGDGTLCLSGINVVGQYTSTKFSATRPIYMQTNSQRLAIPSYIYPCWPDAAGNWPTTCSWKLAVSKMSTQRHLTVFNPSNGPGNCTATALTCNTPDNTNYYTLQPYLLQPTYQNKLLGYVRTTNGARNAADVKADIDSWYRWFNKSATVKIFGIFFDETSVADCSKVAYYTDLVNYAKTKAAGAECITVLNPGGFLPECYMNTGTDILVTFENTYGNYTDTTLYKPAGYETKYDPMRFWHLVHSAPNTTTALSGAVTLSKQRWAGNVFITGDQYKPWSSPLDNPWDTMPGMDPTVGLADTTLWAAEATAAKPTGC